MSGNSVDGREKITKSFFSNSLNIFVIRFLSTLANLMVVVYFSHKLPRADYGRYSSFWVQLNVGTIIASCGFALIAFTYRPGQLYALLKQVRGVYYLLYASFVLLCAVLFALLLQKNQVAFFGAAALWIPVVFFIVYTLASLLETALIVLRQFIPLLLTSTLYPVFFFWLHWHAASGPVFSLERLMLGLLALVAAKVFVLTFSVLYSLRKKKEAVAEAGPPLSPTAVRKLWLHLGIYDVAQMVFRSVDKLIVSFLASKEALAVYYNGSQDIPFLPVFLASVRSASLIQMSHSKGSAREAVAIANKASAILSTVAFAALTYVLCFRYEIIETVFSAKYIPAIPVFVCSMLIIPAQFCCPVFFILQYKQKGAVINKGAMLDMTLAILLMFPLYTIWGALGITISIVAAAYVQTGYYLVHAARALNVPLLSLLPLRNWGLKLALFFGVSILAHYLLSRLLTPPYALIAGGAISGCLALLILWKEYRNTNRAGASAIANIL